MDVPTGLPRPDAPLGVLMVCGRNAQVQTLRRLLGEWPCPVFLYWTTDPLEALRLTLNESPRLALLDARLERSGGKALSRQLSRWSPELEVFVFDERGALGSPSMHSTWQWSELPRVLSWWAGRHLAAPFVPAAAMPVRAA